MAKLKALTVVSACPFYGRTMINIDRCLHKNGKDKPCRYYRGYDAGNGEFNQGTVDCSHK